MSTTAERETGTHLDIKYDANGLVTAIAVDADTNEILMLAYMNKAALEKTLSTGLATYWSRSRQKFWVKGEESGHVQRVVGVWVDCDQDALIVKVRQKGAACHVGYRSCFYRQIVAAKNITKDGPVLQLKASAQRQVDPATVYKK